MPLKKFIQLTRAKQFREPINYLFSAVLNSLRQEGGHYSRQNAITEARRFQLPEIGVPENILLSSFLQRVNFDTFRKSYSTDRHFKYLTQSNVNLLVGACTRNSPALSRMYRITLQMYCIGIVSATSN